MGSRPATSTTSPLDWRVTPDEVGRSRNLQRRRGSGASATAQISRTRLDAHPGASAICLAVSLLLWLRLWLWLGLRLWLGFLPGRALRFSRCLSPLAQE